MPVRAGRQPIARAAFQPLAPLCRLLPPHDHRGAGPRVAARERGDAIGRHAGDLSRPRRRVTGDVAGQDIEAHRVAGHELAVPQILRHDHVHQRERERGIAARAHDEGLVGLGGGLGLPDVDRDDGGAAPPRRRRAAPWLGGKVRAHSTTSSRAQPCPPWCWSPSAGEPEPVGTRPQQIIVPLHDWQPHRLAKRRARCPDNRVP